eukprot:3637826-Pleurochrysis_carterae.AAC.1
MGNMAVRKGLPTQRKGARYHEPLMDMMISGVILELGGRRMAGAGRLQARRSRAGFATSRDHLAPLASFSEAQIVCAELVAPDVEYRPRIERWGGDARGRSLNSAQAELGWCVGASLAAHFPS